MERAHTETVGPPRWVLGLDAAGFLCRAHRNIEEPTLRRVAEFSETAMKVRSPSKLRYHVAHLLRWHARHRRRRAVRDDVGGEQRAKVRICHPHPLFGGRRDNRG